MAKRNWPDFSSPTKKFRDPQTGTIYDAVFISEEGFTDDEDNPIPPNSWALRPRTDPIIINVYPVNEEHEFMNKFEPYDGP